MRRLIFMLICIGSGYFAYCQKSDSLIIKTLEQKANEFNEISKYDSSAYFYKKIADFYFQQKKWLKSAKAYRLAACSYIREVNKDSAFYYLNKSQFIANNHFNRNIEEVYEIVEIYLAIGDVNKISGNYNGALKEYKKALDITLIPNNTDSLLIAKVWTKIGSAHFDLGQYDDALEYCEKSIKLQQEKLGIDDIDIINNLQFLGAIYSEKGDLIKAMNYYQKSIKIYIPIFGENHSEVANSYINIGMIYHRMGNYEDAIEYFNKSLKIRVEIYDENHPGLADVYNNLGATYVDIGDYFKGLDYYLKALSIRVESLGENHPIVSTNYNNIGVVYYYLKDYKKTLEYYNKALLIMITVYGAEDPKIAATCNNIGIVYNVMGEYEKALEWYTKALKIRITAYGEDHISLTYCYNNIGGIYEDKKDYDKAIDYQQMALQLRIKNLGENHPYVARSYFNIGQLYKHRDNYKKALDYFQKALVANFHDFEDTCRYINPKQLNAFSKTYFLETLTSKAQSFYLLHKKTNSLKDISGSVNTYDIVFDLIYQMRSDYKNESTKLLLTQNTKSYFMDAMQAAMEYSSIDQSAQAQVKPFEYLEKSKSATLSAYLNDMQIRSYWNISDSLQEIEKDITTHRNELDTKIQQAKATKGGYDTLLVQTYQDKLFNISRQYDTLISTLATQYPDYYQLKYQQNVATINDLQQQMDNKTALLNYFVADTSLFIAAVTKDSVVYKVIKTDSLFNEQLVDYHIDIEFNFSKEELQASAYLYNYLITPVEDLIKGKNKLIIIPDEKLYYVPFETLCKKGDDILQPDYLIKNYAINYHHSATLWLNSKEKKSKRVAQNSFIGFAPVFDPTVSNGYIVSNEWIADTTDVDMATRSISSDFTSFNALPNTEDEIKAILKLFNKKSNKADGYLHKEASEGNFKQEVNKFKYVHIASHSFTNDKYPALSGIAFSQPDTTNRKENDEDGILYAGESYNLNLSNADLVVLSSCKSGLGKLIKGEGFLSLSRGFIYSGAPNIVYSLWSVNDEPTKNLMVNFYKQILNGKGYAESLREAKLKIMNNPKTSQPKYWAAWVLLGK